jgi:glycosyltransferase involved in cell wall biosynthesis
MPDAPRVSIVLSVHDQARWLPDTLASVRAQTWIDWELVLADDGSTDDTAAVAAAAARADARIRVLAGPRRERAAARNHALAAATGDLVAFLDGDDAWHPEKLARQVPRSTRRRTPPSATRSPGTSTRRAVRCRSADRRVRSRDASFRRSCARTR